MENLKNLGQRIPKVILLTPECRFGEVDTPIGVYKMISLGGKPKKNWEKNPKSRFINSQIIPGNSVKCPPKNDHKGVGQARDWSAVNGSSCWSVWRGEDLLQLACLCAILVAALKYPRALTSPEAYWQRICPK